MINLKGIPKNPGCYLFKDKLGSVIYVGKAKSLVKRVKSYFQKEHEDIKTNVLVSKIRDIDFVVTDSEVEALVLENNLIKKYKPKYNIDLKDSKRYAYLEVTAEKFPRLLVARSKKVDDGSKRKPGKFYGPFVSGMSRDYVLRALRKIFQIRTCNRLPKRKCMRYDIGLCSGPCVGKISERDYVRDVKNAEMVLKGKTRGVIEMLDKKMKAFSRNEDFERALTIREQIRSIRALSEKQKMERQKKYDEDFINWIIHEGRVYLILFNAKKGILENKQFFDFEWTPNFLEEFLVQFYSDYDCPKEVVLPPLDISSGDDLTGQAVKIDKGLRDFIKDKDGRIVVPKQGEKMELLDLVKKNIDIAVFGDSDKIKELGEKLKLNSIPKVIECFDISHLSGTDVVASMVQFRDGQPDKSNYRRFKIRGGDVNDDYAAMCEVIGRRYSGLKKSGEDLPDLVVVDGGKGQLGVALDVLDELKIGIPVISLAKKLEEVFVPGRNEGIGLNGKSKALRLLQEIRDEAHRFAISYQRLLRRKRIRKSTS